MVHKCDCLGCRNITNRLGKPNCPEKISDKQSLKQESYSNVNEVKQFKRDVNTSELYRTLNLPDRFEHSDKLTGYGYQTRKVDSTFQTSNSAYGWWPPNAHTVPHQYYPRSRNFSEMLSKSGMYRNYSLNTILDKYRV